MVHLPWARMTVPEVVEMLAAIRGAGIRNVLALHGDGPVPGACVVVAVAAVVVVAAVAAVVHVVLPSAFVTGPVAHPHPTN
jgi:hypothetical protein